ncbi:hypothetical protein HDV02_002899 [Globomyces sp. JEL0801]|nr:hypothetical protein HDV02_002899 [Globomyces sp. JEL0801]
MKNHGVRFWQKKLGRTQSHRNSLAANLMTELVQHEQIQTTHAKAQVVKYHMEKSKETSIPKLMNTLANRYKDRSGGYVRILKNGHHASGSDRAPISIVELVNNPNDIIYNFAKRQINLVQKQLTDVESKKYHRELVVLRDPKTGALHNMYKLKPRADLTSKTLKQLNRVEIALHKQLVKFNRSLKTYPQARQYDAETATKLESLVMNNSEVEPNSLLAKSLPTKKNLQGSLAAPLKSKQQLGDLEKDLDSNQLIKEVLEQDDVKDKEPVVEKAEPSKSFAEKFFGRLGFRK